MDDEFLEVRCDGLIDVCVTGRAAANYCILRFLRAFLSNGFFH